MSHLPLHNYSRPRKPAPPEDFGTPVDDLRERVFNQRVQFLARLLFAGLCVFLAYQLGKHL